MLGFILRDMMVQRKRLWMVAVYLIVQTVLFRIFGEAALVAAVLASVYFVIPSAFAYDDKYGMEATFASLPISRDRLVVSRYMEIPILAAVAILYYMLITAILRPLLGDMFPTGWLLPALAFFWASLVGGLYLPAVYRSGYSKARAWYTVLFFFGILFPSFVLNRLSMKGDPARFIAGLASVSEGTVAWVLFAAAILILAASCLVSIRLYKKRQF